MKKTTSAAEFHTVLRETSPKVPMEILKCFQIGHLVTCLSYLSATKEGNRLNYGIRQVVFSFRANVCCLTPRILRPNLANLRQLGKKRRKFTRRQQKKLKMQRLRKARGQL